MIYDPGDEYDSGPVDPDDDTIDAPVKPENTE